MALRPSMHRPERRPHRTLAEIVVAVAVAALVAASCGSSSSSAGSDGEISGSITVSAASSLKDSFTTMATEFHAMHPRATATVNFGASSTLATQILDGAPVDVLATADAATMTRVVDAGRTDGPPIVFATNSLEIIVRRGNPSNITSLADLARPGIVYVTAANDVPIGRYAAQVLSRAGVTVAPRSLEPDVKGIVAKVVAGEADAGIVYTTDVAATAGAATGIEITDASNIIATYPIAELTDASAPAVASAWIDFVTSDRGRKILRADGFGPP